MGDSETEKQMERSKEAQLPSIFEPTGRKSEKTTLCNQGMEASSGSPTLRHLGAIYKGWAKTSLCRGNVKPKAALRPQAPSCPL